METKKRTSKPSTNKSERRRGRPAGRNRVPLSLEERRARNAQYERERRNETAGAMGELADAAGCEHSIANADLLATVISQLQRRKSRPPHKHSLDDLQRINDNLETQIALLEKRLRDDPNFNPEDLKKSDSESSSSSSSESDSNSDSDSNSSASKRPNKCRKTTRTESVHSESTKLQIQYKSTSSIDSQDSVWSNNQSDNPAQNILEDQDQNQDQDSTQQSSNRSSVMYSPESISQDTQEYEPGLKFEVDPEQESGHVHQSESTYAEPYNGAERKSLDSLETEDLLIFGTDTSELNLDWPISDFAEILSSY